MCVSSLLFSLILLQSSGIEDVSHTFLFTIILAVCLYLMCRYLYWCCFLSCLVLSYCFTPQCKLFQLILPLVWAWVCNLLPNLTAVNFATWTVTVCPKNVIDFVRGAVVFKPGIIFTRYENNGLKTKKNGLLVYQYLSGSGWIKRYIYGVFELEWHVLVTILVSIV